MKIARDLGVVGRVRLAGRLDGESIVGLMNGADVFALTSRRSPDGDIDGFGIAVVEAALCGTPAVVTSNSGLGEAIEAGIEVAEGAVAGVAAAVVQLLTDEVARRRMGEAARGRAIRGQTWGHRAAQYDGLLRTVVEGGPLAAPLAESEAAEQ